MICPLQVILEMAILRFGYILPAGKVFVKKGGIYGTGTQTVRC